MKTHAFRPSLESLDERCLPSALPVAPPAPMTGIVAQQRTLTDGVPPADVARPTTPVGELSIARLQLFPRNPTYQIQLQVVARPPLGRSVPVQVTFLWSETATGQGRREVAAVEPTQQSRGRETLIYNKKFSDLTPRPVWARHLIAVVDPQNLVRETNEGDNRRSVRI